jgi:hypothetical protein
VKDLEDRNENDAEGSGRIRSHEAWLNYTQGHEDQGDDRAGKAQVKAGIKQVVLVFNEFEFQAGRQVLPADLRELEEACRVDKGLQDEEQQ